MSIDDKTKKNAFSLRNRQKFCPYTIGWEVATLHHIHLNHPEFSGY
jgi:hypothetical protein